MKPRRYRLRGPAPLNSRRWQCDWLTCTSGCGLAGVGRCHAKGEWWNPACPEYEEKINVSWRVDIGGDWEGIY